MILIASTVELNAGLITIMMIGTVVQFGFNAMVALYIHRARGNSDRIGVMEAKLDNANKLQHELTGRLVDERMRAMTHTIASHVQGFVSTLEEMKLRLRDGDQTFSQLGERDHHLELQSITAIRDLKEYIIQHAASKDDLREHQKRTDSAMEKIGDRFTTQDREINRIGERVGARKAGA